MSSRRKRACSAGRSLSRCSQSSWRQRSRIDALLDHPDNLTEVLRHLSPGIPGESKGNPGRAPLIEIGQSVTVHERLGDFSGQHAEAKAKFEQPYERHVLVDAEPRFREVLQEIERVQVIEACVVSRMIGEEFFRLEDLLQR